MSKAYFVHSVPGADHSGWQALGDHPFAVASLADEMGRPMGIGRAYFAAGLFHDAGYSMKSCRHRLSNSAFLPAGAAKSYFLAIN